MPRSRPTASSPRASDPAAVAPWLAGAVASAAILAFLRLGAKSLWLDESVSVAVASLDRPSFVHVLVHREAYMGLYYVLLHLWLSLGSSEWAVRSLSALFAIAAVPVVYALGARLRGPRAGVIAALLLAVNAFHVEYAQEARGYALVEFLVGLSGLLLLRAIERPSPGRWAGYVAASVLALYSHFFAAFVLLAQWLALAFLPRHERPARALIVCVAAISVLGAPLALFATSRGAGQIAWITPPGADDIVGLLQALSGKGGWTLLAVYAAAGATGAVSARWPEASLRPLQAWGHRWLVAWLCLPIALTFGISLVQPIYHERYLIVCLPPAVLLAGCGLSAIGARKALAGAVAAAVALALLGDARYYRRPAREDWRGVARVVIEQSRPGDGLVFFSRYIVPPFEYYRRQLSGVAAPPIAFPEDWDLWLPLPGTRLQQRPTAEFLAGLPRRYRRVWFLLAHGRNPARGDEPVRRMIRESLARGFPIVERWSFDGIEVYRYGAVSLE